MRKCCTSNVCCCAIPMVNLGIYAQLLEFIVLGLAIAIVTFASQRVMGAESIPEWPSYILGVLCLLVALIQPIGYFGVVKEKFRLFRRFHLLNTLLTLCAFVCALAIIIACAADQSEAKTRCQADYYRAIPSATFSLSQYSDTICNILSWVDVGVMGLIWLLLILVQGYFLFIQRRYSSAQRSDHGNYESVYHNTGDNYMMSTRDNAWDARNSYDAYAMHSPVQSHNHSYTPTSTHTPPQQYASPQYDDNAYDYNNYYAHSPQYKDSPYKPSAALPYGARGY